MNREYLLETVCGQTRLAVVEDGALCELYYERPGSEKLSGNLYLGRVQNILPGMNAAFVDIGQEKNAFLHAGDIPVDTEKELADRLKSVRIERMIRSCWCRWPRSPAARRAAGFPATSPCRGA